MENIDVLRRIFTVFGICLLITSVLIFLYRGSFEKFNQNSQMLLHTINVQEKTEALLGLAKDTESGARGYVISNDPSFLEPFIYARANIKNEIAELHELIKDNPRQLQTLDTISVLVARIIDLQTFMVHLKQTGNFKFGNKELLLSSKEIMDSIRVMTSKMKVEQNKLRIIRDLEVREATRNSRILSTIFSITVVTIMIFALVYILWEIRSKKKVKILLNAVLESSQSAIMSFEAIRNSRGEITDLMFVQMNRNGCKMLGIENDHLIGHSFFDSIHASEAPELFECYAEVINKNTIYKAEKLFVRDKIKIWYRIIAVRIENGITVTFDDISKEKGYEEELKNFITELKRSNSELEQFAFVASHDLQEPLRKIQTFGDRLKITGKDTLNEHSRLYIDKMLSAADRMSALINDLLSFSRLARTTDSFEKTDLNKVITDVLSDLELTTQQKKAIIRYDDLPVIEGVSTQLYQLFFNLISNALKFTRGDIIPEINISIEKLNRPLSSNPEDVQGHYEPFVRIKITDNGIGFENQYANRIFEIFQRLNGKAEFEGTGIGLAICKRIVSNHRGSISASGEVNKGSVFVVELPVSQTG